MSKAKIFDLHADLAMAVSKYHEAGENSALKDHWQDKFTEGGITWTAAASFFSGEEDWDTMMKTVKMVSEDIEASGAKKILTADDLDENQTGTAFIMTIEGMCGIRDHAAEKVQWLYDQGNRIGSLEWNDENALATGNSGDPSRGLTELGKEAVARMNELHMIIDVSHANEKTFWDLIDASDLPVIATHSNAKRLCFVERNLTDQQIRALAGKGGLIGLNACDNFISEDPEQRTARTLARHARYIADLAGIEHVACGFDFGAYYTEREKHDLASPEQGQNFIEGLRAEGFTEEEIKDIGYRNVFRFLKKYMQ